MSEGLVTSEYIDMDSWAWVKAFLSSSSEGFGSDRFRYAIDSSYRENTEHKYGEMSKASFRGSLSPSWTKKRIGWRSGLSGWSDRYLRAHSIPSSRAESSKNLSYKWDPTTLLSVGGCMICIGIKGELEQSHLQLAHWGHQVCRGNPRSKDMNFGTCGQSWTHSTFHDSRSVSSKPHFSTSRSLVQISKKAYLFGK